MIGYFTRRFADAAADSSFGPAYPGKFDFTLTSEELLMTIIPTSLMLAAGIFYLFVRYGRPPVARAGKILYVKLVRPYSILTKITGLYINLFELSRRFLLA